MVLVSYSGREINAKLVYYGPGLSGKTTNLEYIYASIPQVQRGKMVSMKTKTERTLFFDFLPVNLGELSGFKTRFLLYTVPGQVYYNATRKLVLKGVDAVVFVADSKRGKMDENVESLENLRDNLREHNLNLDELPWVIQYNKRDLPQVYSVEELESVLNPLHVPSFEAVAMNGDGVVETFKGVSRLLLRRLARDIGVAVLQEPGDTQAAGPEPPVREVPPVLEVPKFVAQTEEVRGEATASPPLRVEESRSVFAAETASGPASPPLAMRSEGSRFVFAEGGMAATAGSRPSTLRSDGPTSTLEKEAERPHLVRGSASGDPVSGGTTPARPDPGPHEAALGVGTGGERDGSADDAGDSRPLSVSERIRLWLSRQQPRDEEESVPDPFAPDPSIVGESAPSEAPAALSSEAAGRRERPHAAPTGLVSSPEMAPVRAAASPGERPSAAHDQEASSAPAARRPERACLDEIPHDGFGRMTAGPIRAETTVASAGAGRVSSLPRVTHVPASRDQHGKDDLLELVGVDPPQPAKVGLTREEEPIPGARRTPLTPAADGGKATQATPRRPAEEGAVRRREIIVPVMLTEEDVRTGVLIRLAIQPASAREDREDLFPPQRAA